MGIQDKKPIDKDRRDTYLQDEFIPEKKNLLTEREVLEKRLFKHSEFKKPYDEDDYPQMERFYTFPKSILPGYMPSSPDPGPPARKPGDAGNDTIPTPDESDVLSSACDCDEHALSVMTIGIVPGSVSFDGTNNCGESFDETGFTSTSDSCVADKWEINVPPCAGCDDFLVLLFSAKGYPGKIKWSHSGAGGEFSTGYEAPCFEWGSWRISLESLFEGLVCEGSPPQIVLHVDTTSPNGDGTMCKGQQEITVKLDTKDEDTGESVFKVKGLNGCGQPYDVAVGCSNTPADSWGFEICQGGASLNGLDAFGTNQPWEWSAGSEFQIIPNNALATAVTVTLIDTPATCVLNIKANHKCASAEPPEQCLPVAHGLCAWSTVCENGTGSAVNECPPNSGKFPSKLLITCNCPSIEKLTATWGVTGCLVGSSDGYEAACGPLPDPNNEAYRTCVCLARNGGNICGDESCPAAVTSTCKGGFTEWSQCWKNHYKKIYNCNGLGNVCRKSQEYRKRERWGRL